MSTPRPATGTPGQAADATRAGLSGRVAVLASGIGSPDDDRRGVVAEILGAVRANAGTLAADPRGRSLPEQLQLDYGAGLDVIFVVGGDGTVNAAASLAVDHGAALLVVPMGTMNLVAKDLGLPMDPGSVIAASNELTVLAVDYASVGGELFLHSALIGMVPEVAEQREEMRGEDGVIETLCHLPGLAAGALNSPPMTLRLRAEHGSRELRTRTLVVSNNPLSRGGVISHARADLASGMLGVYASAHEGPLAPVKLLASLGSGRLPQDPETLGTECENLTVETDADPVSVSLDGEVRDLRTPLEFKSHPRALRVAIPTAFAGGALS